MPTPDGPFAINNSSADSGIVLTLIVCVNNFYLLILRNNFVQFQFKKLETFAFLGVGTSKEFAGLIFEVLKLRFFKSPVSMETVNSKHINCTAVFFP